MASGVVEFGVRFWCFSAFLVVERDLVRLCISLHHVGSAQKVEQAAQRCGSGEGGPGFAWLPEQEAGFL